jgi:hypothetical protein
VSSTSSILLFIEFLSKFRAIRRLAADRGPINRWVTAAGFSMIDFRLECCIN